MRTRLSRAAIPLLLVSSVLSGCASTTSTGDEPLNRENWPICTLLGAVAGGGLGAIESSTAAAYGAGFGAIAGSLICYALDGDQDKDGVHDRRDRCADTPENTSVFPDGCPYPVYPAAAEEPAPVAQDEVIVLSDQVLFAFDSAELTSNAKDLLADIANRLSSGDVISAKVIGHTDSVGSDAYNLGLSERRAQSVVTFLVSQGVDSNKISAEGVGESNPVADNDTDAGRAKNRRVEIYVDR